MSGLTTQRIATTRDFPRLDSPTQRPGKPHPWGHALASCGAEVQKSAAATDSAAKHHFASQADAVGHPEASAVRGITGRSPEAQGEVDAKTRQCEDMLQDAVRLAKQAGCPIPSFEPSSLPAAKRDPHAAFPLALVADALASGDDFVVSTFVVEGDPLPLDDVTSRQRICLEWSQQILQTVERAAKDLTTTWATSGMPGVNERRGREALSQLPPLQAKLRALTHAHPA